MKLHEVYFAWVAAVAVAWKLPEAVQADTHSHRLFGLVLSGGDSI